MSDGTLSQNVTQLAHELAEASASVIRPYFRSGLSVDTKSDDSPVTVADRDSEAAMRDLINARFPDHGIIGEEHGSENEDAEFVWVLDPIDGTRSFISGVPLFCTLIALVRQGTPWLGVINQPIIGDRWIGGAGQPTTYNAKPATVRPCPDLIDAIVYTTGISWFTEDEKAAWERLRAGSHMARSGGTDAYGYGMVASGWVDMVAEAGLQFYDFAALVPVVQQAGGVITDWAGAPLTKESIGQVLASGDPTAHMRAVETLSSHG